MENPDFVPYEESLALRQLDFHELCYRGFYKGEPIFASGDNPWDFNKRQPEEGHFVSSPLWQQAFRWFREEHTLHVEPIWDLQQGKLGKNATLIWFYSITEIGNVVDKAIDLPYCNTLEEARLACLRKLIELTKTPVMEKEFIYPGFLTDEAIKFFGDKRKSEERDGCAVVGTFIELSDGSTRMPCKGDIFIKDVDGNLDVICKR